MWFCTGENAIIILAWNFGLFCKFGKCFTSNGITKKEVVHGFTLMKINFQNLWGMCEHGRHFTFDFSSFIIDRLKAALYFVILEIIVQHCKFYGTQNPACYIELSFSIEKIKEHIAFKYLLR